MTLGYLPQDGLALRGKTVFAECLSVFDHLHALEREAEEITHTLSTADPKSREYLAAADRYSDIADQLHVHDIYTLDSQVGAVLSGLGFSKEDWERKTEEFSGGWQMRIALAKLLLQKPSLLLLDEPTSTSNPATGSRTTSTTTPTPTSSSPTTATSSMSPSTKPSNSGTSGCTSTMATTKNTWSKKKSVARN
jgi:ABC-type lipopolysaccharide export system ATPase subunit